MNSERKIFSKMELKSIGLRSVCPHFVFGLMKGREKCGYFIFNVISYKNEHIVSKLTKYISGNQ